MQRSREKLRRFGQIVRRIANDLIMFLICADKIDMVTEFTDLGFPTDSEMVDMFEESFDTDEASLKDIWVDIISHNSCQNDLILDIDDITLNIDDEDNMAGIDKGTDIGFPPLFLGHDDCRMSGGDGLVVKRHSNFLSRLIGKPRCKKYIVYSCGICGSHK